MSSSSSFFTSKKYPSKKQTTDGELANAYKVKTCHRIAPINFSLAFKERLRRPNKQWAMHFSNSYNDMICLSVSRAQLSVRDIKSTLIREQCTELNVGMNALETKFVLGVFPGCLHNRPPTAYLSGPTEGVVFLDCIIVETWCPHYEMESKWQSMDVGYANSPSNKNSETYPLAHKVMWTVLGWGKSAILLESGQIKPLQCVQPPLV